MASLVWGLNRFYLHCILPDFSGDEGTLENKSAAPIVLTIFGNGTKCKY